MVFIEPMPDSIPLLCICFLLIFIPFVLFCYCCSCSHWRFSCIKRWIDSSIGWSIDDRRYLIVRLSSHSAGKLDSSNWSSKRSYFVNASCQTTFFWCYCCFFTILRLSCFVFVFNFVIKRVIHIQESSRMLSAPSFVSCKYIRVERKTHFRSGK